MSADRATGDIGPVICFGVYDRGKPRTRQMIAALRHAGFEIIEIHADLWSGIEDKTRTSRRQRIVLGLRWAVAYPTLIVRYLCAPRHRVVIVGYPGIVDMLMLRFFARLRGARVVFDVFVSIHDTMLADRGLIDANGVLARLIRFFEGLACRAADLLVLDTKAHVDYVGDMYRVPDSRRASVMVGAEAETFVRLQSRPDRISTIRVLFYGQFIPLHGADTIVAAARLARQRGDDIDWLLIGTGQTAGPLDDGLAADPVPRVRRIDWVPYENLPAYLMEADVGLGIFGTTGKAARVIPNKVFQIIAAGRALVTRDSVAVRELVGLGARGIRLVPPGDAASLLAAIKDVAASGETPEPALAASFGIDRLAREYSSLLAKLAQRQGNDMP